MITNTNNLTKGTAILAWRVSRPAMFVSARTKLCWISICWKLVGVEKRLKKSHYSLALTPTAWYNLAWRQDKKPPCSLAPTTLSPFLILRAKKFSVSRSEKWVLKSLGWRKILQSSAAAPGFWQFRQTGTSLLTPVWSMYYNPIESNSRS